MARDYVFFVHGIGRHDAGWEKPWIDCFVANLRRYGEYAGMTAQQIQKDHFEFVPIGYDSVFQDDFRAKWHDLDGAVANQAGLISSALASNLKQLHSELDPSSRSILWDSVLDAVLWYGWPQARQAVVARVNKQLVDGIEKMRAENGTIDRAHIIAHSLGTSVIHDAILCLSRGALTEKAFEGKNFKWRTVVMVANTSRVMQTWKSLSPDIELADFDVHESLVQPGNKAANLLRRYFNLRHRADPITWPREFDPHGWDPDLYNDVELREYGALKQVHDFTNYFDNPKAHVPVLRAILGRPAMCTKVEREAARAEFAKTHAQVAGGEFAELRAMVNGDSSHEYGVLELARFLVRTFKELK